MNSYMEQGYLSLLLSFLFLFSLHIYFLVITAAHFFLDKMMIKFFKEKEDMNA